ncbi:MAG: glycosyltransferase [Pedobacter sp.]|nr:glycosyltransferase [Pedobacter sp.]
MKVATLITAFKLPLQLERMLKAMEHPDFYFFIHIDKKIDITLFTGLANLPRVTFIVNRVLCNWGGFSFVNAYLTALEEILESGEKFDFYNLMSGQDYPIKPMPQVAQFFAAHLGKNFISYDEEHEKDWWAHAVTRYEMYHFTDLKFKGKYFVQRILNTVAPKRKFPLPIKLYGSSDSSWWTITEESAKYLVDFRHKEVELFKFMKYTWAPDEFLIATILMNSPFKHDVINNNLRLISWQEGIANPKILKIEDFETLANSNKLFARKFDANVDEEILAKLDEVMHSRKKE